MYSVILRYQDSGDHHVTLVKPTIIELQSKIPMYHNTIKTHRVTFFEQTGAQIEDDEDLNNAFIALGRQNLIIKVVCTKKGLGSQKPHKAPLYTQKPGICFEFKNTRHCRFGNNCKFSHQKPPRSPPIRNQTQDLRRNQYKPSHYRPRQNQTQDVRRDQYKPPQSPPIQRQYKPTQSQPIQRNQTQDLRRNQYKPPHHRHPQHTQPQSQIQQNQTHDVRRGQYKPHQHNINNICTSFQNTGQCRWGNKCRNKHQTQPQTFMGRKAINDGNVGVCNSFQNTGQCRWGNKCRYTHHRTHTTSVIQKRRDNDGDICTYFKNTGQCRFGSQCRNKHVYTKGTKSTHNDNNNNASLVLPYRWQRKAAQNDNQIEGAVRDTKQDDDDVSEGWNWCNHKESIEYEHQFNEENKALPDKYEALGSFRRIRRFKGRIMKLLEKKTMGFVEPNYPQDDTSIGIVFYYSDFAFGTERITHSNPLKIGYILEYSIEYNIKPRPGYRAVNIKIISKESDDSSDSVSVAQITPGNNPAEASSVTYMDKVHQIDRNKGKGIIWCSKLDTLIEFDLYDDMSIEKDCMIEYKVENGKAVHIRLLLLDYKWKVFDHTAKRWNKCSYTQCIGYENKYNKNHLDIDTELTINQQKLKRYTRFQHRVKRLNDDKTMGWVQYGYEYGSYEYSIPFEREECNFNMNMLNSGDMISYQLSKRPGGVPQYKCVHIKFVPMRYLWQYKAINSDENEEWTNYNVQNSKEMERKYSKRRGTYIIEHGKRIRRMDRFTGHIRTIATSHNNGEISVDLDDNYSNIDVEYELRECKHQEFNIGSEVQFKMINSDSGLVKAIEITKPCDCKRKAGMITRIDKQRKIGYLKPYNDDDDEKNNNEYQFFFTECNGFNAMYIPSGSMVEFELKYFSKPKPLYKAVKICLHLLPYQWLAYDEPNNVWRQETMHKSKQFDTIYNPENKMDGSAMIKMRSLVRITTFQRKVTDVNFKKHEGLVEINYNKEFKTLCLRFDFNDLKFNPQYLQRGMEIVYELKKINGLKPHWKVINVGFASFLPFYWMTSLPSNVPQQRAWIHVPFGQNMALDRKYNQNKNMAFGAVMTDPHSGKRYRRHTRFKGKVVSLPTEHTNGTMSIFYHRDFSNVMVDFDDKGLELNSEYNFEIKANDKGLPGFKAVNIKMNFDKKVFTQSYTSKLIELDTVNKIGKLEIPDTLSAAIQSNKTKKIKPKTQYISFNFFDCRGFLAVNLNTECVLEYNVVANNNDNDNDDTFQFKAIKVRIPMIPYRWAVFNAKTKKWKGASKENSIKYELKYNSDHKITDQIIDIENGRKMRRVIRFKRKILKIESKRGQVQTIYHKEYGKDIGVWFNFRDCGFNANYLKIGDYVEYSLRGYNATNVLLWLLPYKWCYTVKGDANEEWMAMTYHDSKEMELKYNKSGDDDVKDMDIMFHNELVTAGRVTTFKGKINFDRYNKKKCYLSVVYARNQNLGIRIPHTFDEGIPPRFRHNNWVQFELKRDSKTLNWKVYNIKKNIYESKETKLLLKLQKQIKEFEEHKESNTLIEYKWKWKDDDDSYNIYKPDISNELSKLRMNEACNFSTDEWEYKISKISDDKAKQINCSLGTEREVKRFKEFEVKKFSIPDGEFYEADYQRLSDDEIKKLFYKTVDRSMYQIDEIEDVMDDGQHFQYEVNVWKKCDQLKRSRDEVDKYLWHGTSYDTTNILIKNGFDRTYSETALYGSGTYFALNADYSVNGYCPIHDGYQYILLCKVIVGDSIHGNSSMDKVPLKQDQTEYDTLVDDVNNPSIYVVWRDWLAVPMYRLKFKNK